MVYDATGHYAVFPLAQRLVRDFGTLILIGDSPHPSKQHLSPDLLKRQIKVRGTQNERLPPEYAFWTFPRQVCLFHQYLLEGRMQVDDLITHKHKPTDAPQVYEDLQIDRSGTMGVMFDRRC